jgi:transcriptional regulator with XRE-family HTH domain
MFQRDIDKRAQELESEGERLLGVTLASIQGYLRDDAEPSVAFLREAARILEVREPWLISGHGAPTSAEEARRLEAERRRRGELERAVVEGFSEGLGEPFDTLPDVAEAGLWRLWAALRGSVVEYVSGSGRPGTHEDQLDVDRELARRIGAAVRAPLASFRFHLDGHQMSVARWGSYVANACDALHSLLAYPRPPEEEPIPADWRAFIESREEEPDATEA